MKRNLYGGRKLDGHSVPLIAFNYIVILEKLGSADERTTNCSFLKSQVLKVRDSLSLSG